MVPVPLTDDRQLRASGQFVAEGRFVVERLLRDRRWPIVELILTPAALASMRPSIEALPSGARPPVRVVTPAALEAAAGFHFHQGCLAIARRLPLPAWPAFMAAVGTSGPVVILESVRDPDNIGAIFRSALGLGAAGVVLGPGCADPYYRKTIRTSMAAVLSLPFMVDSDTSWPRSLTSLRDHGFELVALTPEADAEPLPFAARRTGRRLAIVAGSEDRGLSRPVLDAADRRVRVPMSAGVDSLNVATAIAVSLYAFAHTPAP